MKLGIAAALTLCLSGCLVDMLMTTAITADMAAQQASSATNNLNQVQLESDQIRLQEALDYYYFEKESYPRDLYTLVPEFIEAIPTRPDGEAFGYNPISGQIYMNANGPSTEDYFKMEEIKVAINNFGNATGYYPEKLDDLYPNFMVTLPRTSTGEEFNYENSNGRLTHPREGLQFEEVITSDDGEITPVRPSEAIGSLEEGDLKDSDQLNKALDRMGY